MSPCCPGRFLPPGPARARYCRRARGFRQRGLARKGTVVGTVPSGGVAAFAPLAAAGAVAIRAGPLASNSSPAPAQPVWFGCKNLSLSDLSEQFLLKNLSLEAYR
ncbi:unnamed protein product [Eretmochelys imbricata]